MAGKTLKELFVETLRDIYFAEKQILRALPKMANAAHSDALRAGFKLHREETEEHVARLEKIFAMLDLTPRGKKCEAILGIIEEGKEIMGDFHGTPSLDAGLVSAGQAVEHYEIARYGTLKTWAGQLGLAEARTLLQKTLDEEVATDRKLSELAESDLNRKAA
ncbi:MAG TPA: ferritin-like domain-containing protein [Devosiaceae bacterium]|jgi:ferritin-like metal-binding protein YciE|nr:ferritin-like domain-containing protein [Devosiaceae bacterium]